MELLAPAGSFESFIAAIENGADAVYLGGRDYNARQSASNFAPEQLEAAVEYAHLRRKKVYVTLNTLIDYKEFPIVLDFVFNLYRINVDAIIVQDLGLMHAIHILFPALKLHASTQMTIHNIGGVKFARDQGISRVVLAREMSLHEIEMITSEVPDCEVEVFIHGALCYSYSGQCLFSSLVGGRSGNRGRCAQPCRLAYEIHSAAKGKLNPSRKGQYIISPADLCLIDNLQLLQNAGVHSLKIEGRMKRPEYVAVVTRAYRETLDAMQEGVQEPVSSENRKRLLKIFNRNFTTGYLFKTGADFLSHQRPNNRGVYLGRVVNQDQDGNISVKLAGDLHIGDGLEIWVAHGRGPALVVRNIKVNGKETSQAVPGDVAVLPLEGRVGIGDRVFKTRDDELLALAAASMKENQYNKIAVDAWVFLHEGETLRLVLTDERGNQAETRGKTPAVTAEKHPLDAEVLRDKLGQMGNTVFYLRDLELAASGSLMVPFSEIKQVRREAVDELIKLNLQPFALPAISAQDYRYNRNMVLKINNRNKKTSIPVLSVAVSGLDQARAAAVAGAGRVYLALDSIRHREKVSLQELMSLIEYGRDHDCEVLPLLPRIQMISEEHIWDKLEPSRIEKVMAGNLGSLNWALQRGFRVEADYSLNIFNPYSLAYLGELGVDKTCLSPELNFIQLRSFPDLSKCEIIVHGELALLVSRYCMLKGILGDKDGSCPGYCQNEHYSIRDEKGYVFPVETDNYCRFYIFNSRTLCLMDDLDKVAKLEADSIRIEARRSDSKQVGRWTNLYRQALDELGSGKKPDLQLYRDQLIKCSSSPFSKYHYYRGVLQ